MLVESGMKTGLNILTDNPKAVGSDMIVDAVAAMDEYPLPLAIIDMGTATTISVVDKNGNYVGGIIHPGLRISIDTLSSKTAQLPQVNLDMPKKVIGKNTIEKRYFIRTCRYDGRHHLTYGRRNRRKVKCSCHRRSCSFCDTSLYT